MLMLLVAVFAGLLLAQTYKAIAAGQDRKSKLSKLQRELARRDAEWEAEQARHHSQDTDT